MKKLLVLALVAAPLYAADETTEDNKPLSDEARARADETVLELDPVEVQGEGFSYQQEVTLRMIRQAYDRPRSRKQEDKDVLICWVDDGLGSHLNYMSCARNGDLWALERPNGLGGPTVPSGGYGTIMTTERPVNRWKLERAMEALPGNKEFDQEFLSKVLLGEEPPRDVPDEEELGRFASAYKTVDRLARRGASEDRQITAIKEEGLTLRRYNHIVDMVGTYQSLENDVAERLASLN